MDIEDLVEALRKYLTEQTQKVSKQQQRFVRTAQEDNAALTTIAGTSSETASTCLPGAQVNYI